MNKPCFFCGRTDYPTYPTIIPGKDGLETILVYVCRRHTWEGAIVQHALTGMPIYMYGEDEYSRKILEDD